ncbi:MAG: hypothetical protein GX930_09765, partial [Clostridia bacterium]|nr:hypothetical protein [Clostridia bacterium]
MSKSMSKSINLLPAELRQSARTEVRGSLKRIIVMIVALGTVLFYAGFSVWTFYLGKALEDTRTQMDEIRPRLVQVNKIKEENQNLKAEIAELEKVSQDRMSWASVLQDINRHLPQEMWITHMATE